MTMPAVKVEATFGAAAVLAGSGTPVWTPNAAAVSIAGSTWSLTSAPVAGTYVAYWIRDVATTGGPQTLTGTFTVSGTVGAKLYVGVLGWNGAAQGPSTYSPALTLTGTAQTVTVSAVIPAGTTRVQLTVYCNDAAGSAGRVWTVTGAGLTVSPWLDVSPWAILSRGISISRGRESETGDAVAPGSCSLSLDNSDGRFSPDLPSGAYYPNVAPGGGLRVSVLVDGAYVSRFWGTAESWSVGWSDDATGRRAITTVTATDTLGALPSYTFRQPADEYVRRTTGIRYHWPLRDTEAPISALVGDCKLTSNGNDGLGNGAAVLTMEEGTDKHPLFVQSSTGLKLTSDRFATPLPDTWMVVFVCFSQPTAAATLLDLGSVKVNWSTTVGFTIAGTGITLDDTAGQAKPTAWPVVVELTQQWNPNTAAYDLYIKTWQLDTVASLAIANGCRITKPGSVTINPTLSGGAQWSIGHLLIGAWSVSTILRLLVPSRIPSGVAWLGIPGTPAIDLLSSWAGGPTVTGATLNECALPLIDGVDAADAIAELVTGMGARLADNADGTLAWVGFGDSTAPVAIPSGAICADLVWQTDSTGWLSDVTTTSSTDGTTYTATRADGKRQSAAIAGVHATSAQDHGYADFLVNAAGAGARLPAAPVDLLVCSEADRAALCGVRTGSRLALSGLPAQMPTSLLAICEGLDESLTASSWVVTFKLSPDVRSRLLLLDDATQGRLDSGYLLAP